MTYQIDDAVLLPDGRQARILQVITVQKGVITEVSEVESYPQWVARYKVGDEDVYQDDGYLFTGICYMARGPHVWGLYTGEKLRPHSEQGKLL